METHSIAPPGNWLPIVIAFPVVPSTAIHMDIGTMQAVTVINLITVMRLGMVSIRQTQLAVTLTPLQLLIPGIIRLMKTVCRMLSSIVGNVLFRLPFSNG
jgi:hypothetical protein